MQRQTILANFLRPDCRTSTLPPSKPIAWKVQAYLFNPPPFDVRNPISYRSSSPVEAAHEFWRILQWVCAFCAAIRRSNRPKTWSVELQRNPDAHSTSKRLMINAWGGNLADRFESSGIRGAGMSCSCRTVGQCHLIILLQVP